MRYRVAAGYGAGDPFRILYVGGNIRHAGDGYPRSAPRQNDDIGSHSP